MYVSLCCFCTLFYLVSSSSLFMPGKLLNPLPEEQRKAAYPRAIEKVISTSQQLQASFGSMEIPISLSGRLSNVVIWEKAHWALIQKQIPVGTFLRLRNVHIPQRWEANNFRCKSFFLIKNVARLYINHRSTGFFNSFHLPFSDVYFIVA